MRPTKHIIIITILFSALTSCIESYYPREIQSAGYAYVVSGQVTNIPGNQVVRVSVASSIDKPKYIPVKGCSVQIIDSDNNVFASNSTGQNGEYSIWIDSEYLTIGKAFKVLVFTPKNEVIESEFDTLKPCPDITAPYYIRMDKPTTNPDVTEKGVQFKIDLVADNQYDRYFRWELEETYEYRAFYPITMYYDGAIQTVSPPDYSLFYCWQTSPIKNIYAITTKGLLDNKFFGYNLHFVNNTTQKLMYLYSIKVTQFALTENYFSYLEQLRMNSSEQGGLFDTQPITIHGNLFSSSHPEMRILGFFGATASVSERYFFSNIENLPFELPDYCSPQTLDLGFEPFGPDDYPVYLVLDNGQMKWALDFCFDCTKSGGTTDKPTFWP